MVIGIDKNSIKYIDKIKSLGENYLIYIFNDDETLEELKIINMHAIHCDRIKRVDINFTRFNLRCLKKYNYDEINDIEFIIPKKDYKFSIIVPAYNNDHGDYNGKTFYENCLISILNQTYKNFELIIVDDCSTDTTVSTTEKYMKNDNRIHLIKNNRKRYNGGSRNVGIDYAKTTDSDYICFLDSDDWWKDETVLQTINDELYNHDMMLIGLELLDKSGIYMQKTHEYNNFGEFFLSDSKTWCTAWSRIIRKDKIVYFPEDTLMEDRTWSYDQADNVDFDNVKNLEEIMYVWNRLNTSNSVSIKQDKIWEASAYKHIAQQLMLIERLNHKEMIPVLKERIKECKKLISKNKYVQY